MEYIDYRELHRDTINKLHQMVNSGKITVETACSICADFVPDSEDERIKKALIKYFTLSDDNADYQCCGVHCKDIVAWLEKKGNKDEKMLVIKDHIDAIKALKESHKIELEKQGKQKPAVIIPKFKIGDEIKTSNEKSLTITKIDEKGYWSEDLFICDFDEECLWDLVEKNHAWSEEDELHIRELESLVKQVWATAEHENDKETIHKMSDLSFFLKTLKPQLKQELSEDDIKALNRISTILVDASEVKNWWEEYRLIGREEMIRLNDFLKSLIYRVRPQSTEWSEEDKNRINRLIAYFEDKESFTAEDDIVYANWLKSLKDRVQPQCLTVTDEELSQAKKDAYNDTLDKIEYHSGEPTFDDGWSAAIWYLKKRLEDACS